MRQQLQWDDPSMWIGMMEGQQDAFTALVRRYTDVLYTYGMRLCQDEDLVKDCVQEVFLFIWRRRSFLKRPASVKFYLMKAVRNKIMRDLPKWQMTVQLPEDDVNLPDFMIELADREGLSAGLGVQIKNYIDELSPRQREILYLRFYEGFKQQKIAEMMQLNDQSVYNLLRNALISLRKKCDYELLIAHLCLAIGFCLYPLFF